MLSFIYRKQSSSLEFISFFTCVFVTELLKYFYQVAGKVGQASCRRYYPLMNTVI